MYLNELEAERLQSCPTMTRTRVYLAALRLQKDDPVPPWKFFKVARVSPRRGLLELAELVRRRWLDKQTYGPPGRARTVRFVSTARLDQAIGADRLQHPDQAIGADRLQHPDQAIGADRLRAPTKRSGPIASSLRDPDLPSGQRVHKTEPSVPTGEGAGRGDNGRTDGSKKFAEVARRLVGSIASDWQIPEPVVEKCVGHFFEQVAELEPAERELWRYFRAAFQHRERRHTHPAFAGIVVERFLGCACTSLRFSQWREHERKRDAQLRAQRELDQRERERDDESLTPAQLHVLLEERAKSVGQ